MAEEQRVPVLETKKLGISFGGLKAVNDFNIRIYQGELVGLIVTQVAVSPPECPLLTG